ncbi:hypothetical protein V5N11_020178 [Cardamine amara subsp. amara]|uniref:Heme-binding protein n=1 Tax=Cardamine amara subsp. amara TaxID=228776 RepID=A0ABD0ZDB1_CARAN
METGLNILKLSIYLSLVLVGSCALTPKPLGMRPSSCDQYECPTFKLVDVGNGFEIRMYDSAVWISTDSISAPSMTQATKTGFQRLFNYIQGDNKSKLKMNMTAPVITEATPGKSVYTISLFIPKKNQQNPPQADGLHVKPLKPTYVVVRQFSGYVSDDVAVKEGIALQRSLVGTKWIAPILKGKAKSETYLVAVYDPPFQTTGRVNEIMVPFHM